MLPRCTVHSRRRLLQTPRCRVAHFRTTTAYLPQVVDYYKILDLQPDASPAAIKKLAGAIVFAGNVLIFMLRQFYALSKTHHPDRNPDDPKASDRFVKISDAYHVLGHPESRERYDRENQRDVGSGSPNTPRGSYSSAAPFGSRPASGLSKRRSQFRGPPPSFYRSGGWGKQSAKRQAQADATASASFNATSSSGGTSHPGGGFGPAGSSSGFDDDVPHFDRPSHLRTQEQQEQRRRRERAQELDFDQKTDNTRSVLFNFIVISGIIAIGCAIPALFGFQFSKGKRKEL